MCRKDVHPHSERESTEGRGGCARKDSLEFVTIIPSTRRLLSFFLLLPWDNVDLKTDDQPTLTTAAKKHSTQQHISHTTTHFVNLHNSTKNLPTWLHSPNRRAKLNALDTQIHTLVVSTAILLSYIGGYVHSAYRFLLTIASPRLNCHRFIVSYTLLSVERKQLWGISNLFRRRCCRGSSSSSPSCCRNSNSNSNSNNATSAHHQPIPLQDEEEQQYRGKRLLSSSGDAAEYDDEEEEREGEYDRKNSSPSLSPSSPPSGSSCSVPPILLFAVPGAIYFFNNNLTFILLSLMPAPTYVVLSNLKILTTGLFSFLFLHRLLTTVQWISLGILFLSTAVSQIDLEKGLSLSISLQAFLLMILFCSLSAAASVFSEYVMKERFAAESIHLQNMKLYMFGILFNGITYLLTPSPAPTPATTAVASGFFADMAPIHFMIILAYALLGLVTSAIIKFSGSITKVYASSMSMFFAALVSWLLLNDQLTVLFFVGCFGCCYALHLYYRVAPTDTTASSSAEEAGDDDDDDEEEESRRRIAGGAGTERRDSTSSTTSSTTLAASSPVSVKNKSQNTVPLSSVRVVDRNEYLSLDTLDGDHEREDRSDPSSRR